MLWLAEPRKVRAFLRDHYPHFSREGLRYAIEKMARAEQRVHLDERAQALRKRGPRVRVVSA